MSLSAILANRQRLSVQNFHVLDGSAVDSDDEDDAPCSGSFNASTSQFPPFSHPRFPETVGASSAYDHPSSSISSAGTSSTSPRRNEHLAVLIPKHLWKVPGVAFLSCSDAYSTFSSRTPKLLIVISSNVASCSPCSSADTYV